MDHSNKLCKTVLLMILSVLGLCNSMAVESCVDDVHLACTNKDFHDSLNEDGFSLLEEGTLDEHCSDILEDIRCKRQYLSTCDPSNFEAFALATDGLRSVLEDLCNETSDLRRRYRMHNSCLSSLSDVYENCILNTVQDPTNIEDYDFDDVDDVTSSDMTVKRMCRFYEPFKLCVTQSTRTMCGASAAQMVEQIIVRAAAPAISQKC